MKTTLVLFFTTSVLSVHAQGTIEVNFVHLASDEGQVIVSLFDDDQGFPNKFEQAYRYQKVAVKDGKAHHTFQDVPWGVYAVTVMHDEDDSGEIEKNFLGIPKEKVGISKVSGGLPSFKRAVFPLNANQPRSEIIIEPFN